MSDEPRDFLSLATPSTGLTIGPLPVDQTPSLVYLARVGASSRAPLQRCLDKMASMIAGADVAARLFPWWRLRYQHTQAVRAALVDRGYKPATVNQHLAALRGVLVECWRLGMMTAEEQQRAGDLQIIKAHTLPAGREISKGEVLALFETAAAHPRPQQAARDGALLALLYAGGLRRGEIVALDLANYSEAGEITILGGKGGKDRTAWLTQGGRDALDAWIQVRGDWPGPLLVPITKGGELQRRRMVSASIYMRARYLARRARITDWSPHDMRRTFVSHLLAAGADLSAVKELAGHASIATTARYDRRGETAKRGAADLLIVPFRKPGDPDADATTTTEKKTTED